MVMTEYDVQCVRVRAGMGPVLGERGAAGHRHAGRGMDQGVLREMQLPTLTRLQYDTRALYLSYDITDVLVAGPNVIGSMLGLGWKNVASYPPLDPNEPANSMPVLMAIVIGTFANGSKTIIATTDGEWVGTQSPITSDSVYNGEAYDAQLEQDGWSTVAFGNASSWSPVPFVCERTVPSQVTHAAGDGLCAGAELASHAADHGW